MCSATALAPKRREKRANVFELYSHSGETKITYYPSAPGPKTPGRSPGASLKYDGPEGAWTFGGSQITRENTSLGQFISVVLKPKSEAVSLTFWLFLPTVTLLDKDFQSFKTYGVKAPTDNGVPMSGITFEIERLFGDAKAVMPVP
jgi:hypothetical protein